MTVTGNIPTHIVEIADVDTQLFQLRLAGKSTRAIARALKVSEDKVRETVERMQVPLTPKTKASILMLELERLDVFQASQYADAQKGDRAAIACSLEIMKHRADLAGLYAAANLRIDPIQLIEAGQPQETTTEQIQRVIDKIKGRQSLPSPNGSPSAGEPSAEPVTEPKPAAPVA